MFLLHCLLLLLTIGSIFAQGGRKLVFTNFNFTIDPKYSNLTMWLNDSRLSVIAVAGPPTIGLTMDIKLYVKTTGTEEFKHFFTKHQDVCEMLNQSKFDPFIFLIAMAMASKKSNQILGTCPIASVSFLEISITIWLILFCRAHTCSKILLWRKNSCHRWCRLWIFTYQSKCIIWHHKENGLWICASMVESIRSWRSRSTNQDDAIDHKQIKTRFQSLQYSREFILIYINVHEA